MTDESRDLITRVREGASIEIYESKPHLKEGDPITEWEERLPAEEKSTRVKSRKIVGKLIRSKFRKRLYPCPYCGTGMHLIAEVTIRTRIGRDGKPYTIEDIRQNSYIGRICPLCEYQDKEYFTADY